MAGDAVGVIRMVQCGWDLCILFFLFAFKRQLGFFSKDCNRDLIASEASNRDGSVSV
jgi:hypothetical protein